ncbi:hypothetical protein G3M53_69700, partial [Streptomyces sp. SID7982]|nr:hypothetical protein [Streptomyces sp. SID7982]
QFQESRIEQAVLLQWHDEVLDAPGDAVRENVPYIGDFTADFYESFSQLPKTISKERFQAEGPVAEFEKACVNGSVKALKKASMDKVGGAFFMVLAALLACVFITVLDASFLYAQLCLAKEAMF